MTPRVSRVTISPFQWATDLETAEATFHLLPCYSAALAKAPPSPSLKTHPLPFTGDYMLLGPYEAGPQFH